MNFSKKEFASVMKGFAKGIQKHSPEILTAMGIAGMATTVVMAVKATPKALEQIEVDHPDGCTKTEAVKSAWKFYVPAAVTGVCSTACIVGATTISLKRNAALATAYTLSETFAKEYKENVLATIGEKKEAEVRENIAKQRVSEHPIAGQEVVPNGDGTTIFYEPLSARYFKSSMNRLSKVENEINKMILNESYVNINEMYYMLGLPMNKAGDQLGWTNDKGLLEFKYTAVMSDEIDEAGNQIPVISLDYNIDPVSLW